MANNDSSKVELVSECFIRPKEEVEAAKEPYYLAPVDLLFLTLHYLQKGLLFTKPPNFNINSFLDKLKLALSVALLHFYPLAGRFTTVKYEDEGSSWIYLDCNKGPGARFIHATCATATVADIVSSEPDVIPTIRSFFELGEMDVIGYDGHTRALLSVQVTELTDGIFIGYTMNHSVSDGTSFWNFVNSLSQIFGSIDENNIMITHVPIFKPIFPDGYGPIIKLPTLDPHEPINRAQAIVKVDNNLREKIFHFSSSSIAKLKAQANAECAHDLSPGTQISSFQSLCALLWRSVLRARNIGPDVMTTCMLVGDARPRHDPPLSSDHFGNLILAIVASCNMGDLMGNGLGRAAMVLQRSIKSVDVKEAREFYRGMIENFYGPNPEPPPSNLVGGESSVVIGGSVRFNMYGPEFGLGRAVAARTGYSAKTDGKITASPGYEGGGSADLEISLAPQVMIALEQDLEFMSFVS